MPESQGHVRAGGARASLREHCGQDTARVPQLLVASWERSRAAGVDAEHPTTDFTEDIDTGSRLVRCAEPIVARLSNYAADLPISIAVTDSRARVIVRADACPEVGRNLDRVEFAPGFTYAESTMGTNGVGTVIEAGQAVSVVGAEHFTEHLRPFACTGAPIIDPLTGRTEGILDISTLTESWSPLMPALVRSAAHDIGRNLLLDRSHAQQALFQAYLRADARSSRLAVMAFADSVFMGNAAAQSLLSATEQVAIREHAAFALGRRDSASETITLSTGRAVRLRSTRVSSGIDTAGIVVAAEVVTADEAAAHEQARAPEPPRRIPGRAPGTKALTSPAWRRACAQLGQALAQGRPTLVIGETGTGKSTLATDLFHAQQPRARIVVLDATALTEHDPQDLFPRHHPLQGHGIPDLLPRHHPPQEDGIPDLLPRHHPPQEDSRPDPPSGGTAAATLCVLRHLDRTDSETVQRLAPLLIRAAGSDPPGTVVATLAEESLEGDLPFRALLAHFDVAVTLPPLRCRTEDLDATIARLSEDLAPRRQVRFSPAATRTLSGYPWPRNITQLREALAHALRVRPVGQIQEQDLPRYCHTTTTKTLTVLESAERDAIVAALCDHGGNRVAAARHLGISRSSLYRKIKAFGITA